MDKTYFACHKSHFRSFKVKCVFMTNNAPSHVSKFTHEFFEHKNFTEERMLKWSPSSPDLNPIENLWSIVKLYEGDKQYNSTADVLEPIKITMWKTESAEVKKKKKLTKSCVLVICSIIEADQFLMILLPFCG